MRFLSVSQQNTRTAACSKFTVIDKCKRIWRSSVFSRMIKFYKHKKHTLCLTDFKQRIHNFFLYIEKWGVSLGNWMNWTNFSQMDSITLEQLNSGFLLTHDAFANDIKLFRSKLGTKSKQKQCVVFLLCGNT